MVLAWRCAALVIMNADNHQEPFTTRVSTAFAFPMRYHARNHSVSLPIRFAYGRWDLVPCMKGNDRVILEMHIAYCRCSAKRKLES